VYQFSLPMGTPLESTLNAFFSLFKAWRDPELRHLPRLGVSASFGLGFVVTTHSGAKICLALLPVRQVQAHTPSAPRGISGFNTHLSGFRSHRDLVLDQ
jgi:hypothetical protein